MRGPCGVGCAPNKPLPPSASRGRVGGSGAPDSDRTGLGNPPEDWPAASPRGAAAVTSCEPQSREPRRECGSYALFHHKGGISQHQHTKGRKIRQCHTTHCGVNKLATRQN